MIATVASALARTWRIEIEGGEQVRDLRRAGIPIVFAVWHGRLLPALYRHRHQSTALLISGHRDGEYLAAAAHAWGFQTVRGSSTRGGVEGLRRLIRFLRRGGEVGVTPDGPRGPARTAKAGVAVAAQSSGAAIVPVGTAASRAWQASSWDQFQVPGPFARVRVVYGAPLRVAPGGPARARTTRELAWALDAAVEAAECRL